MFKIKPEIYFGERADIEMLIYIGYKLISSEAKSSEHLKSLIFSLVSWKYGLVPIQIKISRVEIKALILNLERATILSDLSEDTPFQHSNPKGCCYFAYLMKFTRSDVEIYSYHVPYDAENQNSSLEIFQNQKRNIYQEFQKNLDKNFVNDVECITGSESYG